LPVDRRDGGLPRRRKPRARADSRPTPPPLRFYRAARAGVHALQGVATTTLVFPFLPPVSRRAIVRRWCGQLLDILNVDLRTRGRLSSHTGNVLVVANHISWLDIFVLNAVQPVRFVAKSELARWPVVGRMIRDVGTLFVERARLRDARRVNGQAAAALAGGDIVAVFPEGTTTDGTELLPFKSSLFEPIVEAHGHVQPVAIRFADGAGAPSTAPAYVGDLSFMASFWRVTGVRALIVELHALDAIPAGATPRRALASAAEASIRAALARPAGVTAPGRRGDRKAESP
jgi:1-acyl-sn-glycerol-3-phosphate acyltransferase